MSLLTICQDAASQLGLQQPSSIVGSSDLTAQILFRLANQAGKELMRYHDWQDLIVVKSFTTVAQVEQTNALATDYDRLVYNAELWNTSLNLRYVGPTTQRTWRWLNSAGVAAGVTGWWRIIGGALQIYPAPTAGQTLVFEYISKNFCQSSGGAGQAAWAADTDVGVLDEELFTLEIVWRFRQARGFPQYAEDLATCEREKEKAAARDRGTGRVRPDATFDAGWPPAPFFNGTIDG